MCLSFFNSLMGPTGAGKSAVCYHHSLGDLFTDLIILFWFQFIESLAAHQGLKISGNSIDGVTQNVVCYKVINLQDSDYPVVLMDTPGLLDPQISERKIMTMISNALDDLRQVTFHRIPQMRKFNHISYERQRFHRNGHHHTLLFPSN